MVIKEDNKMTDLEKKLKVEEIEEQKNNIKNDIISELENLEDGDLIYLYNDYCDDAGSDDRIFYYEDIDFLAEELRPTEVLDMYADCAGYDYFTHSVYLTASNSVIDLIDDFESFAEWFIESYYKYNKYSEYSDIVYLAEEYEELDFYDFDEEEEEE